MLYYIIFYYIILYYITVRYVMLCYTMFYVMLCDIIWPYILYCQYQATIDSNIYI